MLRLRRDSENVVHVDLELPGLPSPVELAPALRGGIEYHRALGGDVPQRLLAGLAARPFDAATVLATEFGASRWPALADPSLYFAGVPDSPHEVVLALGRLWELTQEIASATSGRLPGGWAALVVRLAAARWEAIGRLLEVAVPDPSAEAMTASRLPLRVARDVAADWFGLLRSDEPSVEAALEAIAREDRDLDRDTQMRSLLIDDSGPDPATPAWLRGVDEAGRDDARAALGWYAARWCLPRADLDGARDAVRAALRTSPAARDPVPPARGGKAVLWLSDVVARASGWTPAVLCAVVALSFCLPPDVGRWPLSVGVGGAMLLGTTAAFAGAFSSVPLGYLFFPQVGAGALVGGLLVATLSDKISQSVLGCPGAEATAGCALFPAPLIAVSALLASLLGLAFLRAEIVSVLGPAAHSVRPRVLVRTLRVLAVCLGHSVLVATLVSAALAGPVFGVTPSRGIPLGPDAWGLVVVPRYVVFGAALSFISGLVLQLVWEERTTAEPPF